MQGQPGISLFLIICAALRDLVLFIQFKKREKRSWRSVNFSKVAGKACNFIKINTPPWMFYTFFQLYKWYQIAQRTTYNSFSTQHHLVHYTENEITRK